MKSIIKNVVCRAMAAVIIFSVIPVFAGAVGRIVECENCGECLLEDVACPYGQHYGDETESACYSENDCSECGLCEYECQLCSGCGRCIDRAPHCVDCCTSTTEGSSVVTGIIYSFGNENDEIEVMIVDLYTGKGVCGVTVSGNETTFRIEDVPNGEYVLVVYKPRHVLYEFEFYVDDNDENFNVYLYIKGDLNFDGKVNARDKAVITEINKKS